MIEGEQVLSLFEEADFPFELPSAYENTDMAGVMKIRCMPREKRTRYCYVYRESSSTPVENRADQEVLDRIHRADLRWCSRGDVTHSTRLTDGEKSVLLRTMAQCQHPFLPLLLCEAMDVGTVRAVQA